MKQDYYRCPFCSSDRVFAIGDADDLNYQDVNGDIITPMICFECGKKWEMRHTFAANEPYDSASTRFAQWWRDKQGKEEK